MKRCLIALMGTAALGFAAQAENYTWTNSVPDSLGYWTQTGNWNLDDGSIPDIAPTNNANADILLPRMVTPANAVSQTLLWDLIGWNAKKSVVDQNPMAVQQYRINSVSEPDEYSRRRIRFQTRDYSDCWSVSAILKLVNPNNFYGEWIADTGSIGYELLATSEHTPILRNISANRLTKITVASNKAKVGNVITHGAIKKLGAGELEIGATQGTNVILHLTGGTMTLDGRDADVGKNDVPVKGAWLWLDANNTSTYTYGADRGDGRTYVEKWSDVRGAGYPYAYFNRKWNSGGASYLVSLEESNPPYLNTTALAGKTVLDFGRIYNDPDESHGVSNCWLQISETSTKVREAFFVCRKVSNSNPTSVIGDRSEYPFHPAGQGIAGGYGQGARVRCGTIYVDGTRVSADGPCFFDSKFSVTSVGISNNVTISMIGTDRVYKESGRTGGWKIGEIVLFTNQLTQVERFRVHKYLQHKWTEPNSANDEQPFAEILTVDAAATGVKVLEGKSAYIPEVSAASGTLVKQGAGTLKIGEIASTKTADGTASVEVQGGSVAFGGLESVEDDAPAANPLMWLKADEQYMTISNAVDGSGRKYVTKWVDCRPEQTTYFVELPVGDSANDYVGAVVPYLVENAVGELASVDFGEWGDKYKGTYLNCKKITGASIYEAYQVSAAKSESAGTQPFCTTDGGVQLCNGSFKNGRFVSDYGTYSTSIGRSAVWTLNGVIVDPLANQAKRELNTYDVISLSMDGKLHISRVGNKQRTVSAGTSSWGGVRIGEWIIYNRMLTAKERRQTNAYLTKRWKGRATQAAERKVAKVKFADGVPAVLKTDADYKIGGVDTKANEIVKQGSGTLELGAGMTIASGTALNVKTGTLKIDMSSISQKPIFDFDAQNTASFTTEEWTPEPYTGQPTVDTQMRTNVLVWGDSIATGNYASYAMASNKYPRYSRAPVLQDYTVRPGVVKPFVYFGGIDGTWTGVSKGDTYGNITNDGSAMYFNTQIKAAEFYTIFGDTPPVGKRRAAIVSVRSGVDLFTRSQAVYNQDLVVNAILSHNTYTADIVNGYVATNGVALTTGTAQDTALSDGVNLITFAPLKEQPVDAFAATSDGGVGGGCRIGEQLGFKTALTDAERANLSKYLMKKWFDEDYTFTFASINVEDGATLNLTSDEFGPSAYAVGAITGGGTITGIDSITGLAAISAACKADGSWTKTTLDADVEFANAVTVSLDAGNAKLPKAGDYSIFEANSLDNVDVTAWTVDQATPVVNRKFSLKATSTAIKVAVRYANTMIFVK